MKTSPTGWKWWRIDAAGVGLCALVTAVVGLGGFLPLARAHDNFRNQKTVLATQRDQASKLDAALTVSRGRLQATRQTLARSPLQLRPASTVNRQLAEISALASETGLRVVDIRPDQAMPGTYYETVPIFLAGTGTYPACARFLDRLRQAFPDTSVSSIELLANVADLGGPGRFRLNLQWHTAPRPAAARG